MIVSVVRTREARVLNRLRVSYTSSKYSSTMYNILLLFHYPSLISWGIPTLVTQAVPTSGRRIALSVQPARLAVI